MTRIPYRLVFFLAALVPLGVYAAAVTIPHMFEAGDPIVAEEMNANFAALAAEIPAPIEILVASPEVQVDDYASTSVTVESSQDGRWLLAQRFEGFTLCSSGDARFFLMLDFEPIAATAMLGPSGQTVRGRLSGPTEGIVPAGAYELRIGTECVAGGLAATIIDPEDGYSVMVFPE